ncbi:hypothetical protein [Flagellimonas sediminis]|uniref:Cthe-2314-like HEPN domain-containing protein n=1 Tax=Flagellimonas sediminis TaxID=2696468 RepID=A0A6I5KUM2_9FLAO|nr:hypothetical protein [Allomuricauda sediminis]NDV44377.1 hypothetical protein [Allomuricauda sediminis]
MREQESFRDKREQRKFGLQIFFMNIQNNHYDFVSNKLIKDLEKKVALLKSQIETDEKGSGYMKHMEVYFLEKELYVVSEMKILYGYKHFETHLKWLLKASYSSEINERKLFRWENVEDFLTSKKINPKELSNYIELRDLRNLNNAIKHSLNILDNKTKNIKEFQNKKDLKYTDLLSFYARVEDSSLGFLQSLSDRIEKDLYEFDNERIENISDEIVTRMDTKTVSKLIKKLEAKKK